MLSQLGGLLRADGCPVCAFIDNAERSYFAWFVNENHASASVQAQLRASAGMCPAHSRRLIEDPGPGPVVTTVARDAVAGARMRLREETTVSGCPACESVTRAAGDATRVMIDGLRREGDLRRYLRHPGVCLDHMFTLAGAAGPGEMTTIAQRLLTSLSEAEPAAGDALPLLAHTDADAPRRARWRRALPGDSPRRPGGQDDSTITRLCQELGLGACPVCLAGGLAEQRYLSWWLDAAAAGDPSVQTDPGELCGGHLRDLAELDASAALPAIERTRVTTIRALEQLVEELPRDQSTSRRRRAHDDHGVAEAVQRALRPLHACPACRARAVAEQRRQELLDAALVLPAPRAAYESGHGLCLRHLLHADPEARATRQVARRVIDARLGVIAWELEEIRRRFAWDARHEHPGPEQDAWLRGMSQIDGRVLIGAPSSAMRSGR